MVTQLDTLINKIGKSKNELAKELKISLKDFEDAEKSSLKRKKLIDDIKINEYSKNHKKETTEKYAKRLKDKREGNYIRLGKGKRGISIYGLEARDIKELYNNANTLRKSLGMKTIKPSGFYGKRENIKKILEKQQSKNYLIKNRAAAQEASTNGILAFADIAAGEPGAFDKIKIGDTTLSDKIKNLSPEEYTKMWNTLKKELENNFFNYADIEDIGNFNDYAKIFLDYFGNEK